MAFHRKMTEIDMARRVAEKALTTISVREEQQRLNVWIAKMNLENAYGTVQSLAECFDLAQKMNDSLKVHQHMASIYDRSGKTDEADTMYQTMCRKFKDVMMVWVHYGTFKMKIGKSEQARQVLERSLLSLPKRDHIQVITKFAILDFKHDNAERGRTIF